MGHQLSRLKYLFERVSRVFKTVKRDCLCRIDKGDFCLTFDQSTGSQYVGWYDRIRLASNKDERAVGLEREF